MSVHVVPDQVMLLERPLLKVPHEQLRRMIRLSQKAIERDMANIQTLSNETKDHKSLQSPKSRRTSHANLTSSGVPTPPTKATTNNTFTPGDLTPASMSAVDVEMTPADNTINDESFHTSLSASTDVPFPSTAAATTSLSGPTRSSPTGSSSRKRSASGTPASLSGSGIPIPSSTPPSSTSATNPNAPPQDEKEALGQMLNRAKDLRRKLSNISAQNVSLLNSTRSRLSFLQTLHDLPPYTTLTSPAYASWSNKRLMVHIVDLLLRLGSISAAEQVAKHQGVEDLVDIKFWKDCHRIETALLNGSVTEALAWCKENQSSLRKMKNNLEFSLRMQEFVEFVRANRPQDAIVYSRKWLVPWSSTHMLQIRHCMALLAFGPDTDCPPYREMFAIERWEDLVKQFRAAVFELHSLLSVPPLLLSMYTGLSALKTTACYDPDQHETHPECPTCDEDGLGLLASVKPADGGVPWSHHINSTLVCKLSGNVMEGENYPMALPNGRVYSKQALEELALAFNGRVECPRTGDVYSFDELRKVYIM